MLLYQYMNLNDKVDMVPQLSYLDNGYPYAWKDGLGIETLYWSTLMILSDEYCMIIACSVENGNLT